MIAPAYDTPSAKLITGDWPAHALKARDFPDKVIQVVHLPTFDRAYREGGEHFEPGDLHRSLNEAECARYYLRSTASRTVAVCLYSGDGSDRIRAYVGTGGGRASALIGMPVYPGVVLTDHCGLDRYSRDTLPEWARGMREVLVTPNPKLPPFLEVVV